ncbi:uncharacterized protein LOC141700338 [Apium graveolens]|uniref:DUF4378 domain-containing protein n=1 Tax=Apium graveolens TaxID=4045 RepID=A0A6L5BF36_APIGR|nr:hypothetical protein AG4045_026573 [Apium graveolens]
MTTGMIHDQSLEKHIQKQMGCFTGFRQIFDRHQLLTGKRLYTTKRLPPPTSGSIPPETDKSEKSLKEPEKSYPRAMTTPSPDRYKSPELRSPAQQVQTPPRSSLPHPIFELNEATKYSWKFSKETPRLSLDSRATFDSIKGGLRTNTNKSGDDNSRRSTSVIARLMGLESTPPEPITKPAELTRSASESRVSREMSNNIFQPNPNIRSNVIREKTPDPIKKPQHSRTESRGFKSPQQRKNFFDSADVFPEPKQTTVSIYGEIERRMKLKGIDEQSQDLETLKQILEAMQLKGLLHSKKAQSQVKNKNIVYERNHSFPCDDDEQHSVTSSNRRIGNNSPTSSHRSRTEYRRSDSIPAVSPRRERVSVNRNMRSPTRGRNVSSSTRSEINVKNANVRRNQLISERRVADSPEHRRISPINSPRITLKRNVSDQIAANRSPRNRKSAAQIYPKEKISTTFVLEDESSYSSTVSETDTERCKSEDFKEGKSLLERCDKLLHSIAQMNSAESQPSPISVLDSSFYKDESMSPSPVMKRTISFTDESVELDEEELGSPGISSTYSKFEDEIDDSDYKYVLQILRASSYLREDDDIFLFVEKQHYFKGKDNSKEARVHRRLIFDIATEIIDQSKKLPPWKAFSTKNSNLSKPLPRQIWSELQRNQKPSDQSADLFGIVCGVLKKDLAGDGWGDLPVEMSDAVLDMERLIFKDLIGESIRDLAESAGNSRFLAPRRKIIF